MLALALVLAASLADADAALTAGDADACGKAVQDTLASGTLDVADVARAWILRGKCFTLANDLDRAERSYAVALRVDPNVVVDNDVAFTQAQKALPSVPGLAAHASFIDDDTLEVELDGDDMLLVKGAAVRRNDDEVARVPLEAGQARHKVSGIPRDGLTAVVLDKHGNALVRFAIDPQVKRVFTPAAPATIDNSPTLLTTLGATAIGAGIVGVVTSGIALAALGANATSTGDGQLWVAGVGASTGLFVLGAGMVVVDQGL